MDRITQARDYAIRAHWGQRYGTKPYIDHLDEVAGILRDEYGPELLTIAGYLHDVLEDVARIRKSEIVDLFGEQVGALVQFCTDEPGATRKIRKAATYERAAQEIQRYLAGDPTFGYVRNGIRVKLADRLANVRNCRRDGVTGLLDMYTKEHAAFRAVYYIQDSTTGTLWAQLDAEFIGSGP